MVGQSGSVRVSLNECLQSYQNDFQTYDNWYTSLGDRLCSPTIILIQVLSWFRHIYCISANKSLPMLINSEVEVFARLNLFV